MSESRFDSRPGTRSSESIFRGVSPLKSCIQQLLLALVVASVAAAFAGSVVFRTWLQVESQVAPWVAALSGGAATILFVCAAWTWITRLRWVAVSPDGIRWLRGPRANHRRWDQYSGLQRGTIEWTIWGEDLKVGRYADIEFCKGRPLRISTHTIDDYEELIAEIQTTSADAIRIRFTAGGSHSGLSHPGVEAYGPLRFHPDAVEWGGTRYRWDEIEDYEIAVGYLRIQPAKGTEFLRRLTELGDWRLAVAQLDGNVGSRRSAVSEAADSN